MRTDWPKTGWWWLSAALILLTQTVVGYYGQLHYRYMIAPGDDIAVHIGLAKRLIGQPFHWDLASYPPGFHYLLVLTTKVLHVDILTATTYVWPALLILSGLAIFWLSTTLFGRKVGLLAYLLYALVSLQPFQTASDGSLPNILASGVILPVFFLSYYRSWLVKGVAKLGWVGGCLALALLIVFTHHYTTLVTLITITFIHSLTCLYVAIKEGRLPHRLVYLVLAVATPLVVYYLFNHLAILEQARDLLWVTSKIINPNKVWPVGQYSLAINGLIFQASFVGAIFCFYALIKKNDRNTAIRTILLVGWFLVYFVLSRLARVGEPERLARDLAMPASILAALAIAQIGRLKTNSPPVYLAAIILCGLLILQGVVVKIERLSAFNYMVRYTQADRQARQYLNTLQTSGRIVAFTEQPFWELVDGQPTNFTISHDNTDALRLKIHPNDCFAVSVFSRYVWPDNLKDSQYRNYLASRPGMRVVATFSDPSKTWTVMCQR